MTYKVFTNGSPLPASDLNLLMNQSVMSFADATARDAALTAPTEGMCVYLENNNHFQIYTGTAWHTQNPINAQGDLIVGNSNGHPSRLALGTSGQVLQSNGTTASWANPAGGSQNWTSIASGSLPTGTQTASFTSLPAYDKYLLLVDGASSASAGATFFVQINTDNTNNYSYAGLLIKADNTYSAGYLEKFASLSTNSYTVGQMSNNAGSTGGINFRIDGCQQAGAKSVSYSAGFSASSSNGHRGYFGQGVYKGTSAISSIQLLSGSGNIDAGTYELWGSN
jgi:hypothetical protein